MLCPVSSAELLDIVRQKEVMDADALDTYLRDHPALPVRPSELAEQLVSLGLLTPYQARRLIVGRHKRIVLGQYRLLRRIGRGGCARIYLAEHLRLRRRVALKVLPQAQARRPEVLDRFYREARAVASLDHPNIVRAYDANHVANLHFLVLEFVEGTTLSQLVENGQPLSYPLAVNYISQAAAGLEHAWKRGLVHRDVKPSNLIVNELGRVKLLDMGLARFFHDEDSSYTQHSETHFFGTADYVSPEQIDNFHSVDIRADIYSLGSSFYTLLHGKPPFYGCNLEAKLKNHLSGTPPNLHALHPELPRELCEIVARMMAKNPADRFERPRDVVQALEPYLRGQTATLEDFCLDDTRVMEKPVVSAASVEPVASMLGQLSCYFGAALGLGVALGMWWLGGAAAAWMP